MSGLRADLAGRRLWIVVVGLLVAIIAVLVVLRQASSPAPAPAAVPPGQTAAELPARVAPIAAATQALKGAPVDERTAARRDPFAQPRPKRLQPRTQPLTPTPAPAKTSAPAAKASPSSSPAPADPTTERPPAPSTLHTPEHKPSPKPAAKPKTYTLRHADVRFGEKTFEDIPRLLAFPNGRTPAVQYLGVTADGTRAAFAIGLNATVSGEGSCRPRQDLCTTLLLRRGQRALLNAGGFEATLQLLRVRTTRTRSQAAARRFYARVSRAGACLRDVTDAFAYDDQSGVIAPEHDTRRCRYTRSAAGLVGAR
jgi:hypothetical protein